MTLFFILISRSRLKNNGNLQLINNKEALKVFILADLQKKNYEVI